MYQMLLILVAIPTDLGHWGKKIASGKSLNKETIKPRSSFLFLLKQREKSVWKRVAVHTHFSTYVHK